MGNLLLDEKDAERFYTDGDEKDRSLMERLYPYKFKKDITDRIKTPNDAFDWNKVYAHDVLPKEDPIFGNMFRDAIIATYISRSLNEGWAPNWDDSNEAKWFPWFYMGVSGGFRFAYSHYFCVFANAGSGSAFCLREKRLADYAGKQFADIYKGAMTFLNLKK